MTGESLSRNYLIKARNRLKALEVLFAEEDWSDVVREAQEIVELCLKGMLRAIGIDPPRQHDVGWALEGARETVRLASLVIRDPD